MMSASEWPVLNIALAGISDRDADVVMPSDPDDEDQTGTLSFTVMLSREMTPAWSSSLGDALEEMELNFSVKVPKQGSELFVSNVAAYAQAVSNTYSRPANAAQRANQSYAEKREQRHAYLRVIDEGRELVKNLFPGAM